MPQIARKKKIDPLQKAIPKNPRYTDVLATIDSGASLSRYLRKLGDKNENFKIKANEIFRRMKMTTFVHLVIQVAETNNSTDQKEHQSNIDPPIDGCDNEKPCYESSELVYSGVNRRHTLESVIHGIGECDIKDRDQPTKDSKTVESKQNGCPYLLLDVRDKDEFNLCHIIKAISYPHTMLSRCANYEIREMLAYRNKPGHVIVCYDDDETLAPRVATTLVERGYENVFLLSGGLKVAWKLFPKGLILGDAPKTLKKDVSGKKKSRNSHSTPRLSSATTSCSSSVRVSAYNDDGASSVYASSVGGRSVTSSVRRPTRYTYDTYDSVGARGTPSGGEEFSMVDLAHLQLTLNSLFAGGRSSSTASSRMSTTGSQCSRASTTSTLRKWK